MLKNSLIATFFLCLPLAVIAEPSVLKVNKRLKLKSSTKYIQAVHKEIHVSGKSPEAIKFAILDGMLRTKGYKWTFEGEGKGYILAGFDWRGDTNIMKIEFNESLIQLKYHQAWGDYVCKNLIEGVCYKNDRSYYNYVKNLRLSIEQQISNL
ncbi:hypothetical protein [Litorilituus lipolyticus]|uniref:Uncharacterized protein n=1 Tax=Litorilituus lipolyticus TaxID=2491017 RepID=A0A502L5J7_9GAMM|nr:hypothetical protein [Litorilituus lipolyticus]TPH15577.1 hypothetical protein EPA86_08325 [Litorilituus lipolyticus]